MISPYKVSNRFIAHFDIVIIQFYVFKIQQKYDLYLIFVKTCF